MDWAYIFVVILALLLAVFLIVAGVLAVMFVRVTRQIQHLTGSADHTVRSVRQAIKKVQAGVQVAALVGAVRKTVRRKKDTHEES